MTLGVSRDGASITSLASLFQCLTVIVKNIFSLCSLNLPSYSSKTLPLVLRHKALLQEHQPASLLLFYLLLAQSST